MSTPIPQAVLDQVAKDAAANAPKNLLNQWMDKIKQMPGFQKPAPAPTSSQAQTARDAKAGADAIKNLKNAGTATSLAGGSVSAAVAAPLVLGGSNDRSRNWSRLGYASEAEYNQAVSKNSYRNKPITSANPLRPSQPEGEDTVYAPRIERKPGVWDEGYKMPNTTMDVIPEAAANPDRRATDVALVPDSTLNNGRDNSRTNAKGVVQKGTDMGRSFNDLLASQGNQQYGAFSSNQLPTTGANPFEGTAPKTQEFRTEAESYTGNDLSNFGGDGSAAFAQSRETTGNDTFNPNATRIEGGSDRKKGGSLADALNDKAGINSYMSKFSSGDRERAAGMAFLNADGGLEGLQARDAVNDVVYAGGQHWGRGALTEDGKFGDKYKIDRADARDIASGKSTAAGLLESYKSRITEAQSDQKPVEAQEPPTIEKPGVKESFSRTETITPGINTDIPGNVEFNSNNDDPLPSFTNTGGYKATSKKPSVDYSSIFKYK